MIEFEFDTKKSLTNLNKHGIDFVQAQAVWSDFNFLEVQARSDDEPRFVVIGRIKDKHWSAVITYRDGRVRIISVRRSRQAEVELYES